MKTLNIKKHAGLPDVTMPIFFNSILIAIASIDYAGIMASFFFFLAFLALTYLFITNNIKSSDHYLVYSLALIVPAIKTFIGPEFAIYTVLGFCAWYLIALIIEYLYIKFYFNKKY